VYLKSDVMALGADGPWEAIVEGVKELGRHFILYEIQEVGMIHIGCVQATQLVVPLSLHPSIFLCF
jgi:hypothetical protein